MSEANRDETHPKQNRDARREETDKAFAAIRDAEQRERLEKTMRLKNMRFVKE